MYVSLFTGGHDNTGNFKMLLDIHVPYGVDNSSYIFWDFVYAIIKIVF